MSAIRETGPGIRRRLVRASFLVAAGFACAAQAQDGDGRPVSLEEVVVTGAAAESAYEKHLLRFDVAERIAKACFAYAESRGYSVSLHIIDQFGYAIYVGRMDGQQADNVETSGMKAKTALYFREPTRVWMERSQQNSLMALWLSQLQQFPVAGGLPIVVDRQLVGAIGVGGGTPDQDEACAREGLTAVLGRQPSLADAVQPR